MKYIVIILTVIVASFIGCREVTVGYLDTDFAEYVPDSLVVKAVLNPDDPKDKNRIDLKMPWQGMEIDGVQGTFPIFYKIAAVHDDKGNTVSGGLREQFLLAGKGRVQVAWNHTLPVGIYRIDLEISNEGYDRIIKDIFWIIVK